jgi:hypothetical protein
MNGSFKLLFFYSTALVSKLPVQLVDSSQTIWPELTKLPKHKKLKTMRCSSQQLDRGRSRIASKPSQVFIFLPEYGTKQMVSA